ncbi:50S ribosomal protein L15 [Pirellulimonas nuda]|uniref:Large ribosomal subunit protein uL15 n=1 Tax=Pirellulimonas nuda TaxID=2528009 RepID=A0A518DIH8_9BACT|nr:50S ribosomal protein L15 [Pirellulimonas nuda]QDU91291.1 50S ribosomal protein L15 [Pirellulimonas nuda]
MILDEVHRDIQKNRKRKRLGRGIGSGHGKTCGRGHKGAGSRAGHSQRPNFAGGQMPLHMKVPKRGFNNKFALTVSVVNLGQIDAAFNDGDEVTLDAMKKKNLAKGRFDVFKVLSEGDVTKKLTVSAHRFSKAAVEKIEAAGGKVVIIPGKTPVAVKQKAAKAEKKAKLAAAK